MDEQSISTHGHFFKAHEPPQGELYCLLDQAWELSRSMHGNRLTVHVPGMFVVNGSRGKYRAVSITGDKCDLDCEHCKGSLLRTMSHALDPQALIEAGLEAAQRGDYGMLITGGCDLDGRLPWDRFIPAVKKLKGQTSLTITVHSGITDPETALRLKDAGVDQALVDVIGDDATARDVYHLKEGTAAIRRTMDALASAGLEIVPHIVVGIHFGQERGVTSALRMLKEYPLTRYVIVVLMPTRGTPMAQVAPPGPERVAMFIARARLELPHLHASLGCARPRGLYRKELDVLAVTAGINSLALPSDRALEEALRRGLDIIHMETCCSLG